jgi:hypothetical protein
MTHADTAERSIAPPWDQVAPCDHAVQVYEDDNRFLDRLEAYCADGLKAGEGVVVIATEEHRRELWARLAARGFNLEAATRRDQYIAVDADTALAQFMVDDWPDERLFESVVSTLVSRARGGGNLRRVRAFGEMVVLLWTRGHHGATVRLEHLWRRICQLQSFAVFCAYPKSCFSTDSHASLLQICATHTHLVTD